MEVACCLADELERSVLVCCRSVFAREKAYSDGIFIEEDHDCG